MSTTQKNQTTIVAGEKAPTITITREFDFPRDKVWRAITEKELVSQWMGPRSVVMDIKHWDCRRGGSWSYAAGDCNGEEFTTFYGSFHEVREPERLVQTFTWAGAPDGVSLETLTLEELPGGRTLITGTSVVESFEIRDAILSSGMEIGVIEGYEQLEELLARE